MKKLIVLNLVLFILIGCTSVANEDISNDSHVEPQEETPTENSQQNQEQPVFDKTLHKELIEKFTLDNGAFIEHYRTVFPHDEKQTLKLDYLNDIYLPYNRVGAEEILFSGFDDASIDELALDIQTSYEFAVQSIRYANYGIPEDNEYLQEFDIVFYDIYQNDDVLSIVETKNHILWGAGSMPYEYRVFNIDIKTGKLLSNSELVPDYETLTDKAIEKLTSLGYELSDSSLDDSIQRFKLRSADEFNKMDLPITDSSLIYKQDNQYYLIIQIYIVGVNGGRRIKINLDV